MTDAREILINNNLKVTEQRLMVLNEIIQLHTTFTADTLYRKFQNDMDQATVYRMLHTFINKNIITEIPNPDDSKSYEFIRACNIVHPHLYCKKCKNLYCLDEFQEKDVKGLEKYSSEYSIDTIFVQFTGTCNKCK